MSNALNDQTSPYLLQHAGNPVDWQPWSEDSLKLAKDSGRPILLSIGYSACHWCHVMAHESFEDEETAELMNQLFVNIKVDREERPDLDKIYQNAHYILTQRGGGWPLTVFVTPDQQVPFFAGTYFPKEPRQGLIAFKDLLQRVSDFYKDKPDSVREQNERLLTALQAIEAPRATNQQPTLSAEPLALARTQLEERYDETQGGFGGAPKFPHPGSLERLMRHWAAEKTAGKDDPQSLIMAMHTLTKMGRGGIFDQLGGGFCRYSVDDLWMIPHFEKMLYDNGPLLGLYAQAFQASGDRLFRDVAIETAQWVMEEMQAETGGYYSALDADSEGEEGRYYVWDKYDVEALLSKDEYRVFAMRYGFDRKPNFEGNWHLHVYHEMPELADKLKLPIEQAGELLGRAHEKLFTVREQRIHPGRDDKILTSWNALMIKGMAISGRLLNREDFIDSAMQALEFIHQTFWQNERLLASHKDGKTHLAAYLDDYAFLIDAILESLQCRWNSSLLEWAEELASVLLNHFEDSEAGGFYFTADDHEQLIHRSKPYSDDAIPAGNGIAAYALGRLALLTGNPKYSEACERTLKSVWPVLEQSPFVHNALLLALEEQQNPPQMIVLRGEPEDLEQWSERINRAYAPRRMVFAIPSDAQDLPAVLAHKASSGNIVAYVCNGSNCLPPVLDLQDLRPLLTQFEAMYQPG